MSAKDKALIGVITMSTFTVMAFVSFIAVLITWSTCQVVGMIIYGLLFLLCFYATSVFYEDYKEEKEDRL